jgi:hypothetical protein
MSKGRRPPDARPVTDHARDFRDRLGRAAHEAWRAPGGALWEHLTDESRELWRGVGHAVLDAITIQRRGIRGQFEVGSGYSAQRSEPYVEIVVDLSPAQFSPAKAREIALLMLEVADAAESDAVVMEFARNEIGLDEKRAAQLLDQFRKFRDRRRGGTVSAA